MAFFLLAGKLKDAVSICMKQLKDPQLAIVVCRVFEGDQSPVLMDLIEKELLPDAFREGDRWKTAIFFTMLKKNDIAIYSLVRDLDLDMLPISCKMGKALIRDPSVYILYEHLKSIYRNFVIRNELNISIMEEKNFYWNCSFEFERLGCPSVSLKIINSHNLDKMADFAIENEEPASTDDPVDSARMPRNDMNQTDWSIPETSDKMVGLDFGEMDTAIKTIGLDFGEMETSINQEMLNFDDFESTIPQDEDVIKESSLEAELKSFEIGETVVQFNSTKTASNSIQIISQEDLVSLEIHIDAVKSFKSLLAVRISQSIPKSLATILKCDKSKLDNHIVLRNYTYALKKSLTELCQQSNIDIEYLIYFIQHACVESNCLDSFSVLTLISDIKIPSHLSCSFFLAFSKKIYDEAFHDKITGRSDSQSQSINGSILILIHALNRWMVSSQSALPRSTVIVSATITFMTLFTNSIVLRNCNQIWWLLGLSDKLFSALLCEKFKGLAELLMDSIANRNTIVITILNQEHPECDDAGDHIDYFDEFGLPKFRSESKEAKTACGVILLLSLRYIRKLLISFILRVKEIANLDKSMESCIEFLSELDSVLYENNEDFKQLYLKQWHHHKMSYGE